GQFDPNSHTFGAVKSAKPEPTFEDVEALLRAEIAKPRPAKKDISPDPLLLRAMREHGNEFVVAGMGGMGIPMTAGWLEATVLEPGLLADYLDIVVENQLALLKAQRDAGI